jgi:putative ABC transport system substrate-binding protein
MNRRKLVVAFAGGAMAMPSVINAQQTRKIPLVGVLSSGGGDSFNQFRATMLDLEYIEGTSIRFERRLASGPGDMPALAAELVRLNVDVLYVTGPLALRAAQAATTTIPIVALDLETDPVHSGVAHSLAQPGGNVTGLFLDLPGLAGKWLELLEAAAPGRHRVGLLWDPSTGSTQLNAAKGAAQKFDVDLRIIGVKSVDDFDQALQRAVTEGVRAIVMLSSPVVSTNSKQLAEVMARKRLPAISPFRAFADNGGLLSYGPNLKVFRRVAASYVVKILKGAKARDLPIQQPTTFELVINLKTAEALGLSIPKNLLLRADDVVQ